MPISKKELEELLIKSFPDAKIYIKDLRGDGDHYSAEIISKVFKNKSKVQQHQMVYKALEGKMGGELHALMLQTKVE